MKSTMKRKGKGFKTRGKRLSAATAFPGMGSKNNRCYRKQKAALLDRLQRAR
nr:hypothetical protein [uncultured Desulfobulbus sp.]